MEDGRVHLLCERCIRWMYDQMRERRCSMLEIRPPWQPDKMARRGSQLYLAGIPVIAVEEIAAFEVYTWEP